MTTQVARLLPSKSKVLSALTDYEREPDSTRTYQQIRKIIQAAEALKLLGRDVAEVKQKAERVIIIGNRRIGEEIRKVPKAESRDSGAGRFTPAGKPVRK